MNPTSNLYNSCRFAGNSPSSSNKKKPESLEDEIKDQPLPSNFLAKANVAKDKFISLPDKAYRGIKGDKNFTFFDINQLATIPYIAGGLTLVGCFLAGGKDAKPRAKQIAAGATLYYASTYLLDKCIDTPLKIVRGIDPEQPYKKAIFYTDKNGDVHKKHENHAVYESADYARVDVYHKDKEAFNKTARKMGYKNPEDLNDPEATIAPQIKQTLIRARAYKSLLYAPMVMLALGIAKQQPWRTAGFKDIPKAFMESVNDFWTGAPKNEEVLKKTKFNQFIGKFTIIGTLSAIALANLHILNASKVDYKQK